MSTTKRIVVGYDGTDPADLALDWALRTAEAQHLGVHVVIVHRTDDRSAGSHVPGAGRAPETQRSLALRTLGRFPDVTGDVEVRSGRAAHDLVELCQSDELLVVGSAGHRRAVDLVGGSTSQQVAREAPCPVVVVRPAAEPAEDRIGVGLDGSPESTTALGWACARAAATGAEVVAIHCFDPGRRSDGTLEAPDQVEGHVFEVEQQRLTQWLEEAPPHPGVTIRTEVVASSPGAMLVDFSRSAALVVVGSRGRGAVTGLVLGSTSQHVVAHAACPVAVIR